ncbi:MULTISPECIES: type I glutamate--ammonia ligase [Rhizobium]|uniref:type I glutamate--ammonia ligase n=1 Tax=Rhizobium TaxID=379 RepID=UPI001A8DEF22|nr:MULTISPECIES: type I glutamate--ammonia ligase [Rhizobium]MBN9987254.1 type I glutamate--ammonia ligase [Rhizobium laguerreae]MBX5211889.1 type I glutamate--ammonia ligase [Rhizobium sp. NZLR11]MBY3090262.1 type I glutamate--ammonia ligase [Rhizobium laguerreae]MBY3165800.1 type I glutamate--ammonia ligase [Rhizobium laguerreae]MBY3280477.1 type I glutamate--ammonia ligase [Rhizobium laguerreae]
MDPLKRLLKLIKDNDVQEIDFRFTEIGGKLKHITYDVAIIDSDTMTKGLMIDGSSFDGWKAINESDMGLIPDPTTAQMDPFLSVPTLTIICNIFEPVTGERYNRDPRAIAEKAENYVRSIGIADTVHVGAEPEFFVFDDVKYQADPYNTGFKLDSAELPINSDKSYEGGNLGHRIQTKAGYLSTPPEDSGQEMRSEMSAQIRSMGVTVEKHHHEVAPAQHEISTQFKTLVRSADEVQIFKYCVRNVAERYGKTATFMPKPVIGVNGSGMHVHLSLWKGDKPIFAGDEYAGLSESCLYYIGGIIKHAKALNAFTNPSTNSYKRLVPGYEAPVLLAYSARNRSAACRIPFGSNPEAKRVEVRFPDPAANPYLAFAAIQMAGLDGIRNKIDPGPAIDKDLYDLPLHEKEKIPTVSLSLREALDSLHDDRAFLKAGGVFNDDFIDSYIKLKMEEVTLLETTPHPVEFQMYYS